MSTSSPSYVATVPVTSTLQQKCAAAVARAIKDHEPLIEAGIVVREIRILMYSGEPRVTTLTEQPLKPKQKNE